MISRVRVQCNRPICFKRCTEPDTKASHIEVGRDKVYLKMGVYKAAHQQLFASEGFDIPVTNKQIGFEKLELSFKMQASKSEVDDLNTTPVDSSSLDDNQHAVSEIYIDPVQEAAVLRKFDKIVLPQCFIFLLLNYLDRSNIGVYSTLCSRLQTNEGRKCQSFRL